MSLAWSPDHDHGPAFEIPLYLVERAAALFTDYPARALTIHLVFLGAALLWAAALRRSGLGRIATLTLWAMLVLHPRIYAHSFYNSKDIGNLIAFLFLQAALVHWIIRRRWTTSILAGAGIGFAIAIRITGLIALPAIVGALLLRREMSRKLWVQAAAIGISALLFAWVFWPAAWERPVHHLIWAFTRNSRYQPFNGLVLFRGALQPAGALPWYYPIWWIGISTPLTWWLLLAAGLFEGFRNKSTVALFSAIIVVGSLAAVWYFHSVLYDDWRHLYYLWPCLLWPVGALLQRTGIAGTATRLLAYTGVALSGIAMVTLHPFNGAYFNELFAFRQREYLRSQYDLDYWTVGYRQGLRWLSTYQPKGTILLYRPSLSVEQNVKGLPEPLRSRFQVTRDSMEARYRITNFRGHPTEYNDKCIYRVYRQGSSVLAIYKMN